MSDPQGRVVSTPDRTVRPDDRSDEAGLVERGEAVPFCVPAGWIDSVFIKNATGPSYRLLFYKDGSVRFEHRCDRGDRGVIICAPRLQLEGGHVLTRGPLLTVTPSILCSDCGTHGVIADSRWSAS